MIKYVNADNILQRLEVVYERSCEEATAHEEQVLNEAVYAVLSMILLDAPAEDVAPIMRGKWERVNKYDKDSAVCCSACGERFDYIDGVCYLVNGLELPKYCPACGATMMEDV